MRLLTALILAPTISAAGPYPTESDLKSGVRLEAPSGAYSIHILDEAETVKVDIYDVDGAPIETRYFMQKVLEARILFYDEVTQEVTDFLDFSYRLRRPLEIELGAKTQGVQFETGADGKFRSTCPPLVPGS